MHRMEHSNFPPDPGSTVSEDSFERAVQFDGMSTRPRRGVVNKVCRDWLVLEDGALAHQLQSQEIEAYYGHNRQRNRVMRQDAPQARIEQEDELKQALAWEKHQRELREKQLREDEEAARRLAAELQKEDREFEGNKQTDNPDSAIKGDLKKDISKIKLDYVCNSIRGIDLHQPMSEDEAREWQELCDVEFARKLQQEEEEESRYRRDITDLSWRLEMEAKDRELARALYEKEKERLRRAKEKARLKAKQKVPQHSREQESRCASVSPVQNIAVCIDPTWNGGRHELTTTFRERTPVPVTDLDFPLQPQPNAKGKQETHEKPMLLPPEEASLRNQNKSPIGCSHQ